MTNDQRKRIIGGGVGLLFALVIGYWSFPVSAHAGLRVEPAVIDAEAFLHEEEYFTVRIINDSAQTYRVYPFVGEFDAQSGTVEISGTPYDSNRLISANLELPREDFSVAPGASRSLTGKIIVSPYIPPGVYHAVVAFMPEYRGEPGKGIRLDPAVPRALLNVAVRKDVREQLNLNMFRALRKAFLTFPARLSVSLHNGGNVALSPDVAVRFLDRRDREQGSVAVVGMKPIAAGDTADVPVAWNGDGGFGRYRAHVDVNYGIANGGQLITASTVFWVLPVWLLVLIAVMLVVLSYGAARVIVRRVRTHDEN